MSEKQAARKQESASTRGRSSGERTNGAARAAKKPVSNNATPEEARFIEKYADQLSPSTRRAKWIHSADERPDRPGQTLATRVRAVIEQWAEERGARPATVPGSEHEGRPGVLRMIFADGGNRRLQEITWDDWFASFEQRELVFLYQQQKRDGATSNFFRLDNPRREDG